MIYLHGKDPLPHEGFIGPKPRAISPLYSIIKILWSLKLLCSISQKGNDYDHFGYLGHLYDDLHSYVIFPLIVDRIHPMVGADNHIYIVPYRDQSSVHKILRT